MAMVVAGKPPGPARKALRHGILIAASLVMVYPLLWLVASAFKPEDQIFHSLSPLPGDWRVQQFQRGLERAAESPSRASSPTRS